MGNLFNCAMRWELIEINDNPMRLVRVKDSSKRLHEPRPLTVEEFSKLLPQIPEPFRTMCIVAMCLGLRVSEVLGLQWSDFDFPKMQVFIRRSWVYGKVGDVKTKYSNRWMPLDQALANVLKEHRVRTASELRGTGWVFANPQPECRGGQAVSSNTGCVQQVLRRAWAISVGTRFDIPTPHCCGLSKWT